MEIPVLNLRDTKKEENDVLKPVKNSNVENKQLPTLNNNNSDNNCIAKQNIKQSCSNGKIGTIPKEPKRSYASFFKTNEPLSTCETTTTGNNSNKNNNDKKESSFDKVINVADMKQNDMLDEEEDEYIYTLRLGEFLSNYKINNRPTSLMPRGLKNPSTYCYVNSILQSLISCPPFYNLLKAIPILKNRNAFSPSLMDNMVKFAHEFNCLPKKGKRNKSIAQYVCNDTAFEPLYLHSMLSAANFCKHGRQEDAEEFLSYLLNTLDDEMLEVIRVSNNNSPKMGNNINDSEWRAMKSKNKKNRTCIQPVKIKGTPLSNIFRGQLRSRISRQGQQATDNIEPFFALQLDVHKTESIQKAFELLFAKDELEGMKCSKTKKSIKAWKQMSLEHLPVILILHLKWFVYDPRHPNGYTKIIKDFEFPMDLEIDNKFLSSNLKKLVQKTGKHLYKLCAVTYHNGTQATNGHYIADGFHVQYNTWLRYNDNIVKSISEDDVLKPKSPSVPYLLYYKRCAAIDH